MIIVVDSISGGIFWKVVVFEFGVFLVFDCIFLF